MKKATGIGIIGCGDFLRWQSGDILSSKRVAVRALFDTDPRRAQSYATKFKASVRESAEDVIADPSVDIVCLFVPPWVRRKLLVAAAKAGKHVLTTKPLGSSVAECAAMVKGVGEDVRCGVIYRRTGNAMIETCKRIFDSGKIGSLALYRQDWLHHYPQWNTWALDPARNGGPFMDAMIHNMNIARYLMGRPAVKAAFFRDSHAHSLPCADTESMKLDFEANGSAHLFITWAADLAVYSTQGNDREHIDIFYMVTDKGWRVTETRVNNAPVIAASKDGKTLTWPIKALAGSVYDRFVKSIETKSKLPSDIPGLQEAYEDIQLVRTTERACGRTVAIRLS